MNYLSSTKQEKAIKSLPKYLKSKRSALIEKFGESKTELAIQHAILVYPEIACKIPVFNTPMYDALVVLGSKMAALKKGLKQADIGVEDFVRFNIELSRKSGEKVPKAIRNLGGKIYLSGIMRKYLKNVAQSATENGWPTKLISGTKDDDFEMSVETRNCQMLEFFKSVGESDIQPYCTFFDFSTAEMLGVGLKQISTIDSGVCKYCFYKKGKAEWPKEVQNILNSNH